VLRELLQDLGRCVLPLDQLNHEHDVRQRATGSVVFVSEWMRFARTKYPAGARPLVVPD
jgi:hypothetical protein